MATGLDVFWHPVVLEHDTGSGLWEAPSSDLLDVAGAPSRERRASPEHAVRAPSRAARLADRMERRDGLPRCASSSPSTTRTTSRASARPARQAAGVSGRRPCSRRHRGDRCSQRRERPSLRRMRWRHARSRSGYALVRPPGHHAGPAVADGYCFFNNVALAAERFRAAGAERVAIVDWDVHHGNGTQACFYERDDVLTISLHMRHGSWGPSHPETGKPGRGRAPARARDTTSTWS